MIGLNIGGKTQGYANEFAYESDGNSQERRVRVASLYGCMCGAEVSIIT